MLELDVAVDHAARVRRREHRADLREEVERVRQRERLRGDRSFEAPTVQELHDHGRPPVGQVDEVVELHHGRVVNHRRRPGLLDESLHQGRVPGELLVQHLHRRLGPDARVLGQVHDAQGARGDGPKDPIVARHGAQRIARVTAARVVAVLVERIRHAPPERGRSDHEAIGRPRLQPPCILGPATRHFALGAAGDPCELRARSLPSRLPRTSSSGAASSIFSARR